MQTWGKKHAKLHTDSDLGSGLYRGSWIYEAAMNIIMIISNNSQVKTDRCTVTAQRDVRIQ